MMPAFRLLARLKGLRGTPWDPFGRTTERRAERALIADYVMLVERVLGELTAASEPAAADLLALYGEIRGYGPVKHEAMLAAKAREPELLAAFETAGRGTNQKQAA